MTPLLHPYLVNDRFGDPALYIDFLFEKRGLLFDLGDIHALPNRKILRLTDIFVSHAHIDHFIGFGRMLRVLLGREKKVRLYGPHGFLDQVAHSLGAFSWNLAERYTTDLCFEVVEVQSADAACRSYFRFQNGFQREDEGPLPINNGLIFDDGILQVTATILDHRIPCLAFALQERAHVNVWKNRLTEKGLPVGPWLRDLKRAVLAGTADEMAFRVWWREDGEVREQHFQLGRLKAEVLNIVPGQKIAYVVDARFSAGNQHRIIDLVAGADILFIEAAFANHDAARAADRCHLTTGQAGVLAREAGVRRLEPFHFSPRYAGQEELLMHEVCEAFAGEAPSPWPSKSKGLGLACDER